MFRNVALVGCLILTAAFTAGSTPASLRFHESAPDRPAAAPAAPIRLTASDGTGLTLVALEANGVLQPPLAFTELRLTFENPRDQLLEGRFRIALPPGAALSRFAMKIGDAWQEGEVVERQRARVAYEDFLHRRQDPALLEQETGNEFSARVFPIPPRGRKELIVSYSYELARADEPYRLPLLGLPEVGQLDARVLLGDRPAAGSASNLGGEVSERRMVELHKRDWTPDRDLEVRQDQAALRAGLRHENLVVARVAAPVEPVPEEIAGLYVLVDSSASRALGYAAQTRRLGELIAGLRAGASTPLGVAAFDQEVVPVFEGRVGDWGEAEARRLGDRRPLGASDLHQALTWLGDRLGKEKGRYPRVLLITDGVATAGETETRKLKAAVSALRGRGVARLDVLSVGGLRDDAVLRELVTGNLERDGQRIDGAAPLSEIGRRLTLACRSGIKVKVDGAAWIWPETLDGIQPGDQALVYADLPSGRPFRLSLSGKPVNVGELATTERPLLERAWAQARIDRLIHLRETALSGDEDLRRALTLQITELSVKHRVLTPYTALLVLETQGDYARFGLDRKALADILTVGPGGLEVLGHRQPTVVPMDEAARKVPASRDPEIAAGGNEALRQDAQAPVEIPAPAAPAASTRMQAVEGGVVGGVPGGVAGGTVRGVPSPSANDDAPLRVGAPAEVPRPEPRGRGGDKAPKVAPYSGRFAEVMEHLAAGRVKEACALAEDWSAGAPGDVLSLLALGEAWEAAGEKAGAARAYGSLIDLFPSRADLRRLAGERLEKLGDAGLPLAIDTYRKAAVERPDHPSGHRLLAWSLLRAGRFQEAFEALETGVEQRYPQGRFAGVDRVMREDLGLLAAAWLRAEPKRRGDLLERLRAHNARLAEGASLRFVLTWETDANDVDLHVYDRHEGHAYYSEKTLPSGGELVADVTTGYGPECFAVSKPETRDAAPYRLWAHYYSRGPMGYGMGTVQVVRYDGEGRLTIEPRPFVVMADNAMVDLGEVLAKASGR